MRKFGQEIILATAGKKIHGTGAIPGGINKNLSLEERDSFLRGPDPLNIDKMISWAQAAVDFFKDFHKKNKDLIDSFVSFPSNHVSLVGKMALSISTMAPSGRSMRMGRKSSMMSTTGIISNISAKKCDPGVT